MNFRDRGKIISLEKSWIEFGRDKILADCNLQTTRLELFTAAEEFGDPRKRKLHSANESNHNYQCTKQLMHVGLVVELLHSETLNRLPQ